MDDHDKGPTAIERVAPNRALSPAVAAIIERNLDPATVRELVAIQREHEANEARKAYTAALVGLKADLPRIIGHDKTVDFNTTHYTHTSLGACVEAVTPHLIAHGFAFSWHPATPSAQEVAVTCRLTHGAGHHEEVMMRAPPDPKGGKNGAQAIASTTTMLQRYTLLALLGIATADMSEVSSGGDDPAPPSTTKVDVSRNLSAVGKLKKLGKSVEEACAYVDGRSVEEWTEADLKKLQAWAKAPAPTEGAA
jgi:hypothetical protein